LLPSFAAEALPPASVEEAALLEKMQEAPTATLYAELGRLRLQTAARFYGEWEKDHKSVNLQQALIYADSASRLSPDWDKPWTLLGMIHATLRSDRGALELSTEALIRAVDINPANGPAQLLLAQVLMQQGRLWSAIEQYKSLFAKNEAMITGINTAPLAMCYVLDGRTQAGMLYFQELAKKYPKKTSVLIAQAILQRHGGKPNDALALLNQIATRSNTPAGERDYAKTLIVKWKKEVRP
jgi:tetratricopeptide (TPR) repeat protein